MADEVKADESKWHPVDDMGMVEFFSIMNREFGVRRTVELVGWAVVFGLAKIENTAEVRQKFLSAGIERTKVWRALKDYHRVSELCWENYHWKLTQRETFALVASLKA